MNTYIQQGHIQLIKSKLVGIYKRRTRHFSEAANQHDRMISEGSCDTEDWSNDAENSAFPSQE